MKYNKWTMKLNDNKADEEFKSYLNKTHVRHIPFGIMMSVLLTFPSAQSL